MTKDLGVWTAGDCALVKVCLVTSTGGSIGRATALAFAREGAQVVVAT